MSLASAHAQTSSPLPKQPPSKIESDLLSSIGLETPKLTPFVPKPIVNSLPVKVLYDGPDLNGNFVLDILISKRDRLNPIGTPKAVSKTTLYMGAISREMDAIVNLPDSLDDLQIEAAIRDSNENLVLESPFPLPLSSKDIRFIRLFSPNIPASTENGPPDFTDVESISGEVVLPARASLPLGSMLHVQLLENSLAGGTSLELIAQTSETAVLEAGNIRFNLQRGLWDRADKPDMLLKAWISDRAGRKIFVMKSPTSYNGPDVDYLIQLEGLRQGRHTKRGLNLNAALMAQTLIQGEATFDPVNGIPGQARLNIQLKQDRGDFNRAPVLAEQTFILRNMETRVPFSLTTDSTNFDPYAPAPFLSVSLTDLNGRIYYESGNIRAREDNNFVQLYPR